MRVDSMELIESNKFYANSSSTASLNLRTGLHCGEVTAGVLRGDRVSIEFIRTVNLLCILL